MQVNSPAMFFTSFKCCLSVIISCREISPYFPIQFLKWSTLVEKQSMQEMKLYVIETRVAKELYTSELKTIADEKIKEINK